MGFVSFLRSINKITNGPAYKPLYQKIGAKPTSQIEPQYSLPVIYDSSTDTVVSDSADIAKYLDATYPDSFPVIPPGTASFHHAFTEAFEAGLLPLLTYALPSTLPILNAASQEYFQRTRSHLFGAERLEDVFPPPHSERDAAVWKQFKEMLGRIDGWMKGSKYFMGEQVCYADITLAGWLYWVRLVLSKEKWAEIESWHAGRWARLMEEMGRYE
ncbi:hypothetical protein C8F01DRAFT_1046080 [Mycena amicta]|nr:hypothetical protein C8F01DRAFT_1046080 [Mycena amicta]